MAIIQTKAQLFVQFSIVLFLFATIINAKPIYKDSSQPISKRVRDLLSRMTVPEKAAQLNISRDKLWDETGKIDSEKARKEFADGIGTLWYSHKCTPEEFAAIYNAGQKFLLEETRLGIPALFWGEGLHGFMADSATVFPQAIALASTWDPALVEKVYSAVALEMRSRGPVHVFAPVIGLARDPRWGRTDETYGEDPWLVAQMGMAAIWGLQGRGAVIDKEHVAATAKHFAVHSQPEDGTNCAPGNYSERIIRDNFFYPFEMAVKKAGVVSIMAAYNEIDGIPAHKNRWLLTDVLRNEWGFKGVVTADANGVERLFSLHHVAVDKKHATQLAINAGIDIELVIGDEYQCFHHVADLVSSGQVTEAALDSAVSRALTLKFFLGLFDDPYVDVDKVTAVTHCKAHQELALQAAQKAVVLLKNENAALPLDAEKIKNLAVIGPNAADLQFGSYSMSAKVGVNILQGFESFAGGEFDIHYAEGCKITTKSGDWRVEENPLLNDPQDDEKLIRQAVETAQKCDAVVLALGGNESTCREAWSETHLGDRDDLNLVGRQNDLFRALLKTGTPVIVVLINGRPLTITDIDDNAAAILECWYLGEETGAAVADVVFGNVNPGGKLPITFPRSVGQLPIFYNHKPSAHDRSYLFADSTPLYPFGYGLSYTTFSYANLKVTPETASASDKISITVDVTNTGQRTGDEVVQLYIRDLVSSVTRPVKELKGFKRLTLEQGETKTVTFEIGREELQFHDVDMQRVVEPGEFKVMVGTSSVDYLTADFAVR